MNIFWFRRDLRINDNTALHKALSECDNVQPIFIFDNQIVDELDSDDARITFLYLELEKINQNLNTKDSSIQVFRGEPYQIFSEIINNHGIVNVYINKDYEPYAIERDLKISALLKNSGGQLKSFKDQVIFEENEVVKNDGLPYTVFTPFKNKWLAKFNSTQSKIYTDSDLKKLSKSSFKFPSMSDLGFKKSKI